MLHDELRRLATELADNHISTADAAARLRELATFRPDERCRRMNSPSRFLAILSDGDDPSDDRWELISEVQDGRVQARVLSNTHSRCRSNFDTEIRLHWLEPADIDVFGRGLCAAAAELQADRDRDPDEED